MATKGTKPTCKDANSVPNAPFGPPMPTVNSTSDGGKHSREPLHGSGQIAGGEKGSGKDGN